MTNTQVAVTVHRAKTGMAARLKERCGASPVYSLTTRRLLHAGACVMVCVPGRFHRCSQLMRVRK